MPHAITYLDTLDSVTPNQLQGFFVGWPNPPSPTTYCRLLQSSQHVILARDEAQIIGFITAISDGVLCAYIPLLEVLPAYQRQGIDTTLVQRMLTQLAELYMVDLLCDDNVQPFYQQLGMQPAVGAMLRNYDQQAG